ncbi:MAG: phage holin family protein [Actinobacteria bacterium]|nr:phage holin family protein [Actinomycetota bacterium]
MKIVLRWAILAGSFWVINTLLGSLLKLFTLPAVILTFGLFVFVINAAMLMLTDRWSDVITIDRFTSALIGSFIISIVSGLANKIVKRA